MCVCVCERERDRQRQTETDRQTDADRQETETDRDREKQTDGQHGSETRVTLHCSPVDNGRGSGNCIETPRHWFTFVDTALLSCCSISGEPVSLSGKALGR